MAKHVDNDQTAPLGADWSGSALFAYVIFPDTLVFEILNFMYFKSDTYLDCAGTGDFNNFLWTTTEESVAPWTFIFLT